MANIPKNFIIIFSATNLSINRHDLTCTFHMVEWHSFPRKFFGMKDVPLRNLLKNYQFLDFLRCNETFIFYTYIS